MNGKTFEEIVQRQIDLEEKRGKVTMSRYGTHAIFRDGKWTPIHSLPDFEGVLPPFGRQFIFDCKVCGGASFSLHDEKLKERQLRHMYKRSRFGVICFLLIYFRPRQLATKTEQRLTIAIPVHPDHDFWARVQTGEIKSLNRETAIQIGVPIEWTSGRSSRPDVLAAIKFLEQSRSRAVPDWEAAGEGLP